MTQRTARRPLIGITAGTRPMMDGAWAGHDAVVVTEHYVRAIREAGGRPVILSAQEPWSDEELSDLDAIVLTGGSDLDPGLYDGEDLPTALPADPARDAFEVALYRTARRIGLPVLGICRGLQLITVAEGGDLHQHLPQDLPEHPLAGERPTLVRITVEPDSDLALALDGRQEVTAFHHQGIREVPAALRVVARHESGLPMALEAAEGSPVLAVQWHPELDVDGHGLFTAVVGAVSQRAEVDEAAVAGLRWAGPRS